MNQFENFINIVHIGTVNDAYEYLQYYRLDPSINDNFALLVASRNNNTHMVQMLLSDPRVNPCANENEIYKNAMYKDNEELIQIIMQDHRVNIDNLILDESISDNSSQEDPNYNYNCTCGHDYDCDCGSDDCECGGEYSEY